MSNKLTVEQTEKRKRVNRILIPIVLILFAIVGVIIYNSIPDSPPNEKDAFEIAQQVIKSTLIDPPSAEFIKGRNEFHPEGENGFIFLGNVKATNKLGLKAPMEYNIKLTYIGGDKEKLSSWRVDRIDLK